MACLAGTAPREARIAEIQRAVHGIDFSPPSARLMRDELAREMASFFKDLLAAFRATDA